MDTLGRRLRRFGIAVIGGYYALGVLLSIVFRILPRRLLNASLNGVFWAAAVFDLVLLAGAGALVAGFAIALRRRRSGVATAHLQTEAALAAIVLLIASLTTFGQHNSTGRFVAEPSGPTPTPKPYNVLYPDRRGAEPGDVEARRGESVTLQTLSIAVTDYVVMQERDEFEAPPGWYLVVTFRLKNLGTQKENFSNLGEWSFDTPENADAEIAWPDAPMKAQLIGVEVEPGETFTGHVALFLGESRSAFAHGPYYAVWKHGACYLIGYSNVPKEDCRGVWPVGRL